MAVIHNNSKRTWGQIFSRIVRKGIRPFIINHQTRLSSRTRQVDHMHKGRILFWGDKLTILLDFLQILGLYWITANPFPLPYPWVTWTRWWVAFNFDIFSFLDSGALAGKSGNLAIGKWGSYTDYLDVFVLPYVLITALVVLCYWRYTVDILPTYGKRWNDYQGLFLQCTLQILNFLYLPTGIVAFRSLYCYRNTNPADVTLYMKLVMSSDSNQICYEGAHLAYLIFILVFYVPIFLGLPVYIYNLIADNVIYSLPADHEKRLQAWELCDLLHVDEHFSKGQVWLLAPHTRSSAYYRVWMICLKAVLLLLYAFCRGTGVGDDNSYKQLQAFLFWIACTLFIARFCIFNGGHTTHRVISSSIIFYTLCAALFCNTSIGVFNAAGTVNFMMVNSTQTLLLIIVNAGSLAAIVCVLAVVSTNPYALWPAVRTIHRIESRKHFRVLVQRWLAVLWKSIDLRDSALITPSAVIDVKAFEKCIRDLRSCWLAARHCGSIFELIIGEQIEEMIIQHDLRKAHLYRSNDSWDAVYAEAQQSGVFSRRNDQYRLMAPRKRRILTKLLALRILQQREPEVDSDFLEALAEADIKASLRSAKLLERRTRELLDRGKVFEKKREEEILSVDAAAVAMQLEQRKDERAERVSRHGNFIASPQEVKHMADIEETLYRWENIIDTVEEYIEEHPFTRRIYTADRTENWYSYRHMLVNQIATFHHYFGTDLLEREGETALAESENWVQEDGYLMADDIDDEDSFN